MTTKVKKNAAIIGSGLGGTLMAMYLAQRDWNVEIYERRPDLRISRLSERRSINMTLTARGLAAMSKVMALGKVLDLTIPLKGRMVHDSRGSVKFIPYGIRENEVIYAVMRSALNARLVDIAETYPNIRIEFDSRCVAIDKKNWSVYICNEVSGEHKLIRPDFVVGADGTFSTVRQQIHRGECANYQQEYLESGYRELVLPAAPGKNFQLEKHALHVWPRGKHMLMAIPNTDGSFACNCILPQYGTDSLASLKSPSEVTRFFQAQFPDAAGLIEGMPLSFFQGPYSGFLTTRVWPWHYRGRVVLIGDACHTVVPFYGQGMNAAFEDCSVLDGCLERHRESLEPAFAEYQQLRKENTDALADLSVRNFVELSDKVRSPLLIARKQVFSTLHRLFPKSIVPLYTMVSHSTMPYAEAVRRAKVQDRRARYCGIDVVVLILAGMLKTCDIFRQLLLLARRMLRRRVSAPRESLRKEMAGERTERATESPAVQKTAS